MARSGALDLDLLSKLGVHDFVALKIWSPAAWDFENREDLCGGSQPVYGLVHTLDSSCRSIAVPGGVYQA